MNTNAIAQELLGWLWRSTWQATVLVLLILVVQAAFGRRLQAYWRHALWWIVLVKLVVPVLPEGGFSLVGAIQNAGDRMRYEWIPRVLTNPADPSETALARPEGTRIGNATEPDSMAPAGDRAGPVAVKPTAAPVGATREAAQDTYWGVGAAALERLEHEPGLGGAGSVGFSVVRTKQRGDFSGVVVLALWGVGVGFCGLRWVVQNRSFARRLKRTARPVSAAVRAQFESNCERMRVGRGIEVVCSPLVSSPAVYGVWRPTLLLPVSMAADFTADQLDHVFLHELAHVRRGDLWANGWMELAQALHWFNPVVWLAMHRMRLDRELAADVLALSVAGESAARAYGHTILEVLDRWVNRGRRWSTVGILEDPSQIMARMRAIARYRRPGVGARWGGVLVGMLAMTGLTDPRSAAGSGSEGEVLLSAALTGWKGLGDRNEIGALNEVLRMPETIQFRGRLLKRVAGRLAEKLGDGDKAAAAWETILKVAVESESVMEIRGDAQRITGWAVGLRLGEEGLQALREAVEQVNSARGTSALGPRLREGKVWTVMGGGTGALDAVEGRVGAMGTGAFLDGASMGRGEFDLARLMPLLAPGWECPLPLPSWPTVKWVVESRDGGIKTKARLTYAQAFTMDLPAWQVPTNHLSDPMVHFMAVRGTDRWFEWLGSKELTVPGGWPKQVFEWTLAGPPWSQFFAAPVEDPGAIIQRVWNARPSEILRRAGVPQGALQWRSGPDDRDCLELVGMPYFQPYLANGRMGEQRLLKGGLLPPWKAKPVPPELLAQLEGRPDLIYYEWETTGREVPAMRFPGQGGTVPHGSVVVGKLKQLKELEQFRRLLARGEAGKIPLGSHGEIVIPGGGWIDASLPRLGDTITEVSKTGPSELTLERRSQVGFHAREWMRLLRWAEEGE